MTKPKQATILVHGSLLHRMLFKWCLHHMSHESKNTRAVHWGYRRLPWEMAGVTVGYLGEKAGLCMFDGSDDEKSSSESDWSSGTYRRTERDARS